MNMQAKGILEGTQEADVISGISPAMQAVNSMVADIARTNIPVLLLGESGTGKEIYARLLHRLSGRAGSSMKKVSCAALEAGRFREQVFEASRPGNRNGDPGQGTLFFDGVDELDLACQRILLSLLPDGDPKNNPGELSARLISATSRSLEKEIEAGRFRGELYFRINGACLRLPPLRQRKEDIPALLGCFFRKHAGDLGRPIPSLDPEEMNLLMSHDWPGNIRELENVAKKIVALGNARVALGDLRTAPPSLPKPSDASPVSSLKVAARAASHRTERELILKALERTHWNRKRTAQELQISYKSLLYKLKQIGIPGSDSTQES